MKHVETDHMKRKGMIKYAPKMHPDCFSPKELSVLSNKAMSQHPLTQAFLYKKQQNQTINASISTAPSAINHLRNTSTGRGQPSQ